MYLFGRGCLVGRLELKLIWQDIKAAALRTLTSIVHLECRDRTPRVGTVVDATGVAQYHGFLPVLVRRCIKKMTDKTSDYGRDLYSYSVLHTCRGFIKMTERSFLSFRVNWSTGNAYAINLESHTSSWLGVHLSNIFWAFGRDILTLIYILLFLLTM